MNGVCRRINLISLSLNILFSRLNSSDFEMISLSLFIAAVRATTCLLNGYPTTMYITPTITTSSTAVTSVDALTDQVVVNADTLASVVLVVNAWAFLNTITPPLKSDGTVDTSQVVTCCCLSSAYVDAFKRNQGTQLVTSGDGGVINVMGMGPMNISFAFSSSCPPGTGFEASACGFLPASLMSFDAAISVTFLRNQAPYIALLWTQQSATMHVMVGGFAYFVGTAPATPASTTVYAQISPPLYESEGPSEVQAVITPYFSLSSALPTTSSGTVGTTGLPVNAGQAFVIGVEVSSGSTLHIGDSTLFTVAFGKGTQPVATAPFVVGQCPVANADGSVSGASSAPVAPASQQPASATVPATQTTSTCMSANSLSTYCTLYCATAGKGVQTCTCDKSGDVTVTCLTS
jgi:hypothetical protein